jgi:hypothetical protein
MTDQPAQPALPVPTAAWALAWSCLAEQVLVLGERGAQSSATGMLLSALIGAVVVAWVSNGVLTARRGRLILVWAMFVLGAILYGVALLDASPAGASDWRLVHFASSLVQLACLAWFTNTEYFAWQRSRPRAPAAGLGGLILVAVLVGALGGVIGSPEDAPVRFRVNV